MYTQTNSQLFEQRRIKHLLQQARMKRNSQFDWLTESPRFRYSLNSSKDDSSDDSSICDHEQEETRSKSPKCFSPGMDVGHAESTLLSRYNIKPKSQFNHVIKKPRVVKIKKNNNTFLFKTCCN
jgi:hypothetical protein